MRVLVTRPEPAATRTADTLRALGHEPVVLPLSLARRDPKAAREALNQPFVALALTSAEAVRTIAEIEANDPSWRSRPVFAVGAATAEAARAAGFVDVTAGDGDGAALADRIAALSISGRAADPLLYLAGRPRAKALERRLVEHGVPFRVAECYTMAAREPSMTEQRAAFSGRPIDCVLLYSPESARRFIALEAIRLEPDLLRGAKLACMSASVADCMPAQWQKNVRVARAPNEANLLELLAS